MNPTTCIHSPDGESLCPDCQAEYDEDPDAWEEFGHHAAGENRWQELRREMYEEQNSRSERYWSNKEIDDLNDEMPL